MSQMARSRSIHPVVLALLAALAAGAWPLTPLMAQHGPGILEGFVHDALTGEPLPGVLVTLLDHERSTRTDGAGRYAFDSLPTGPANIRLEAEAYTASVDRLRIREGVATRHDFALIPTADALSVFVHRQGRERDHVVMGDTEIREGVESVATELLQRGVSGIVLRPKANGNGSVGTLLRSATSIIGSNEPVVYVDGLRVIAPDGKAASILDQIDLSSVERIEVLKGAAAGVQYGPNAGNGVILVYTKRGGGA